MILDTLDHSACYAAMHKGLGKALAFLSQTDLGRLAPGRHEIDGNRLYAIVAQGTGKGRKEARLEAHRRYIDIQMTLAGTELIGWRPTATCRKVAQDYDAEKDCALYLDPPDAWIAVPSGTFAIFFPHDAHAPLAGEGEVTKVVVKVAVDWAQ